MSVDTYLKRKNLTPYAVVEHEGLRILVAPSLMGWAQEVHLDVRQGWFSRSFVVEAWAKPHKHGPTCAH